MINFKLFSFALDTCGIELYSQWGYPKKKPVFSLKTRETLGGKRGRAGEHPGKTLGKPRDNPRKTQGKPRSKPGSNPVSRNPWVETRGQTRGQNPVPHP